MVQACHLCRWMVFPFLCGRAIATSIPSAVYSPISDKIFYIIFILDDVLELGDLASGAYYTYDAYQTGFRSDNWDPGCEDHDFALTPLDDNHHSECSNALEAVPLPECSSSDLSVGGFCSTSATDQGVCGTDESLENCGLNQSAIYKAVPQNCQLYITPSCATIKQALCMASTVAMLISIGCSSCFHHVFMFQKLHSKGFHMDGEMLAQEGCTRPCRHFCIGPLALLLLLSGCILLVLLLLAGSSEEQASLTPVAFCIVIVYTFGLVSSALVACYYLWAGGEEKWIGMSAVMQLPGLSLIAAFTLKGEVAKQLHEKRSFFKFWLRLGQDVPDLIIAAIDMWIFDFSAANAVDLIFSVIEVLLYMSPFFLMFVQCLSKVMNDIGDGRSASYA